MGHTIKVFVCSTCEAGFLSEEEIRAHQDHFTKLHMVDPEIDEHDGEPWASDTIDVGREFEWPPRRVFGPWHHSMTSKNWSKIRVLGVHPETDEQREHIEYEVVAGKGVGDVRLIEVPCFVEGVYPQTLGGMGDVARRHLAERSLDIDGYPAVRIDEGNERFNHEIAVLGILETRALRAELAKARKMLAKLVEGKMLDDEFGIPF